MGRAARCLPLSAIRSTSDAGLPPLCDCSRAASRGHMLRFHEGGGAPSSFVPMLQAFAGGQLFGTAFGSGAPRVIALHGWARTHADFAQVLGGLDPDVGAVALDLPGFGATPAPPDAWGGREYAEAVAPLLAELPAPPVILGHSFGGRVAVHLAAGWPDLVHALVLTGVPLLRMGAGRKPALRFR